MITGLGSLRINHKNYSTDSAQHTLSDYRKPWHVFRWVS